MNFPTQFRDPIRFHVGVGSRERITYGSRYAKDGTLEIIETGKENIYDYIQSHAQSVDINVILSRFNNGDVSALSRVQGVFGDFTGLPTNFAGMLNMVNSGREYFEGLPVDVRSQFSHSFEKFIAAMDDPNFLKDVVSQQNGTSDITVSDVPSAGTPAAAGGDQGGLSNES